MSNFKHKSEKIHNILNNTVRKVNLHHIKAVTGAGNGFKYHHGTESNSQSASSNTNVNSNIGSHKSEKIHHYLSKARGKVNLHEIKNETGAGNGMKHSHSVTTAVPEYDIHLSKEALLHKSERIHHFLTTTAGKVNLHHIKAQTGAGSGFKHHDTSPASSNNTEANPKITTNNDTNTHTSNHKSEKIHHYLNKARGKVNLHEIKNETGAGNGMKHSHSIVASIPEYDLHLSKDALLHKSERIHHFISTTSGKVNLHHIKAQTGAGSGHKHN